MKPFNAFFSILFFLTLSAQGQNLFIGVKAGANFTNANDNFFNDKVFKKGLSTGITLDYILRNKISLGADILYSQKGFGNYFIFGDRIGSIGATSDNRQLVNFHYDYLSIPLRIGYSIGQTFSGFGNLGMIPSYLLNAKMKFHEGTSTDQTDQASKFDFAGQIELGCGYKIKDSYFIYTSVTYANSLTYVSNQNYFSASDIKNYGVAVSLGLRYKLTHK